MSEITELVGFNILRIREKHGLTQEKLGTLAGLHRAYIGQVERGEKNLCITNLEKIARALNVNIRILVDTSVVEDKHNP
jgi:transcriptional regulator with XRE-family HTH domain